jgi:hypothetical protein
MEEITDTPTLGNFYCQQISVFEATSRRFDPRQPHQFS